MYMPIVEAPGVVEAIEAARGYYGEASFEFYDAVDAQRLRELAEYLEEAPAEISSNTKCAGSCADVSQRCGGCCGQCASRKPTARAEASVVRSYDAAQSTTKAFKVRLAWHERYGVETRIEAASPDEAIAVAERAMLDGSFNFPTDISNFDGTDDAHVASVVEMGNGIEPDDPYLPPLEKYCE